MRLTFKILITCFLLSAMLIACKKTNTVQPANQPTNPLILLPGKWKWESSWGGWGSNTISPDSDVLLKLNQDSSFNIMVNSNPVITGVYSIWKSNIADSPYVINYSHMHAAAALHLFPSESVRYLSKDSIVLHDWQIADGYQHLFIRVP